MILTNPTDDQLNAAFAERVCGWVWTKIREARRINGDLVEPELFVWCRQNGEFAGNPWQHDFTRSVDAVLPWLEKWRDRPYLYRLMQIDATCNGWVVKTAQPDKERSGEWHWSAEDESLARACVIALLRAHGVEVEFTK